MSSVAACIFGCEGLMPSEREKSFFREVNPAGFILFARNCSEPAQVLALTDALREATGRADPLILIDQEGGRVARLKPPHWRLAPPAEVFAQMAQRSLEDAHQAVLLNARLIAQELAALGINVNCVPLADLRHADADPIIGDRAYGTDPEQVAQLAGAMAEGMLKGGVLPVLKHLPGHGRADQDSHKALPVVTATLETLRASDFIPFQRLRHLPLGMTAHILYTALDAQEVATCSSSVIRLIRKELGFDGLLMSDDLSMGALSGHPGARAKRALVAGCDVALHCNGKPGEMEAIAKQTPALQGHALARFERALALLDMPPEPFDLLQAARELQRLRNAHQC